MKRHLDHHRDHDYRSSERCGGYAVAWQGVGRAADLSIGLVVVDANRPSFGGAPH